jgi:MFS superfamily sulfate permease-like transporter
VIVSFLSGFVACASLPRSAILFDQQPRSNMAALFTAGLLLFVLLFLTFLFEHLPLCVVASIIMVALKGE